MATKIKTYGEAIKRLEQIVALIDNNELELDVLTAHIAEANNLIAFCQEKLTKTDAEVEKMLQKNSEIQE